MTALKRSHRHFINWRMLGMIVGWLLLIEGVFLLVPTGTCIAYGESDWKPFASTALLTLTAGGICARFCRPTSSHMGKRDGYLLTAMVWVVFSIFGIIPYLFSTKSVN
ncbi:MAG: hypothetical protein K2I54_09300, partial [Muribaculaceae bacterium]|nr:hypothetical protein [Muribaculaceae bacterium]